jgi:hypothetical protein
MSSRSIEAGGNQGTPHNQDQEHFKALKEEGRFHGIQKPEEPKQQSSKPNNELSEYYRREQERHSGVLENPIRVPRPLPRKP